MNIIQYAVHFPQRDIVEPRFRKIHWGKGTVNIIEFKHGKWFEHKKIYSTDLNKFRGIRASTIIDFNIDTHKTYIFDNIDLAKCLIVKRIEQMVQMNNRHIKTLENESKSLIESNYDMIQNVHEEIPEYFI